MSEIWRNRIVGSGFVDPAQLLANPRNARIHDLLQQRALLDVLRIIGWVSRVIVNKGTGFVVDGHLRVALALRYDQPEVPVDYVDLSEEEEILVLKTFDSITEAASYDREKLRDLMETSKVESDHINRLLQKLADENRIYIDDLFPDIPDFSSDGSVDGVFKVTLTAPAARSYEIIEILDALRSKGVKWRRV